jgi:inhibitor of cysteine peptidase
MKNNDKYDKVITDFDLDFIKKKFDDDGVTPPLNLESGNIKNAIEKSHNKRIKFTNSKVLKTAVSLVACIAIVAVSLNLAFTQNNQKPPVTNNSVKSENAVFDTFSSAKEIKEYFKSIEKNNKSYNFFKDTIKGAETAKDTASLTYSKTNVQVENVDEADIIKNDGKYIYTASSNSENKISIYKPDGKKVKLMSQIEYNNVDDDENEAFISDIYIYNNSLIAQSYSYDENSWEYTNIDIYSLADIKKPKKIYSFSQQGSYVSSRITNGKLLVVSNRYISSDLCKTDEDYLPKTKINSAEKSLSLKDICIVNDSNSESFLIVSEIDLLSKENTVVSKAIAGAGINIYCNENNLYIANSIWDDQNQAHRLKDISPILKFNTEIYKIDITSGIKFTAKATVSGAVNNQFSMDEYAGNFRIATTASDEKSNDINKLYIFDSSLKKLGEIEGFAKGESIQAVRFSGNTAYVITYENTDPLFVIDLSNPQEPKIKGSVKISGFSTNLIPISSNQLLGIGYADDNTNPYTDGIKFVLFDVSNPQKPTVLDSKVIHNATSEAQDNHKAILVNGKSSFVIPYEDVKSENEYTVNLKAGAIAFEVKDNKINISKKYATKVLSGDIVRSTIFDNAVYTFNGGEYVNSFSLEN